MSTSPQPPSFASLLQDFFCKRLIAERNLSAQTVASYRDTFRLFLKYAERQMKKAPEALTLADLDAPVILGFLDQLQKERATARAPATSVWWPCAPSSAMPPIVIRRRSPRSSGSLPFH